MPRKSPIEHKVGSHQRRTPNGDIITVEKYTRGSGKPPRKPSTVNKPIGTQGSDYAVTFYFSSGRETHKVDGDTLTGALREAIPKIQRPEVPRHAQVRRRKR